MRKPIPPAKAPRIAITAKAPMGVTSGPSICSWTLQLGSDVFALQKALAPVVEMKLTALHPPVHISQFGYGDSDIHEH